MCRNHSHLVARFVGEDTTGLAPVLTFALASSELTIEGPFPGGTKLIVPTSGLLLLPSWSLDGSFRSRSPQTEVRSMSLCCIPGDGLTIMQEALIGQTDCLPPSRRSPVTTAGSPTAASGAMVDDEVFGSPF